MGTRRTARRGRFVAGVGAIALGAIVGSSGAVGWLSLLSVSSIVVSALGILFVGVVPIVIGLGLIWSGLDVLGETTPTLYVSDGRLLALTADGATRDEVARRLRLSPGEVPVLEERLDDLVVRGDVELVLSDDGSLVYFAHPQHVGARLPQSEGACFTASCVASVWGRAMNEDRRHAHRHFACFPAHIRRNEQDDDSALISDLSVTGALLMTRTRLDVGQRVQLALFLTEDLAAARHASARVVRVQRRPAERAGMWVWDAAIEFDQPLDDLEDQIRQLAERQSKSPLLSRRR